MWSVVVLEGGESDKEMTSHHRGRVGRGVGHPYGHHEKCVSSHV